MKTMTGKQLAREIVSYLESKGIDNVYTCSSYAVAKQFLGQLTEDEFRWADGRGGVGLGMYEHLIPEELKREVCLRDILRKLPIE